MGYVPTTTVLSLILAILGFFTAVISVTTSYYRRISRPLDRLELVQEAAEAARWAKRPVIWEVRVDRRPTLTSKWGDLSVSVRSRVLPFPFISSLFRSQFRHSLSA
jgi:hypothetical protein